MEGDPRRYRKWVTLLKTGENRGIARVLRETAAIAEADRLDGERHLLEHARALLRTLSGLDRRTDEELIAFGEAIGDA